MRTLPLLILLAASAAWADTRDAKEESASGGATAPKPSFGNPRNDAASQALFNRLDKNRDGFLTGSELTTGDALSANWLAVDRDADGRISRAEFSAVETTGDVARK